MTFLYCSKSKFTRYLIETGYGLINSFTAALGGSIATEATVKTYLCDNLGPLQTQ